MLPFLPEKVLPNCEYPRGTITTLVEDVNVKLLTSRFPPNLPIKSPLICFVAESTNTVVSFAITDPDKSPKTPPGALIDPVTESTINELSALAMLI